MNISSGSHYLFRLVRRTYQSQNNAGTQEGKADESRQDAGSE